MESIRVQTTTIWADGLAVDPADSAIFAMSAEELDRYPAGIITLDRSGTILHYNRTEAAITGMAVEDVLGKNFFVEVAPCTAVAAFEGRFRTFATIDADGYERFDFAFRFVWGVYEVEITLMRRAGRPEIHVVCTSQAQRTAADAANAPAPLLRPRVRGASSSAAGPMPARLPLENLAHWHRDPYTNAIVWSPTLRSLLAAPDAFVPDDESLVRRVHPADRLRVRALLAESAAQHRPIAVQCRMIAFDRSVRHVLMHAGTHVHGFARRAGGTVIDETARVVEHRRLRHITQHDPLTGLANVTQLRAALVDALASGTNVAVAYLDLDGFKRVNDVAGHAVGDALLCIVASRLRDAAPQARTIARVSGDEFAAIFESTAAVGLDATIAAILDTLARPMVIADETYHVTASIGIATDEHSANAEADALLDAADDAMYAAKLQGKNAAMRFDPMIREAARVRESAETLMRRALVDDRVVVYLQPIVDAKSAHLVGC